MQKKSGRKAKAGMLEDGGREKVGMKEFREVKEFALGRF